MTSFRGFLLKTYAAQNHINIILSWAGDETKINKSKNNLVKNFVNNFIRPHLSSYSHKNEPEFIF